MSIFKFKQFEVQQKYSAAKIGTDAVLLGAWVESLHKPQHILDVGSGTGVISLMLAQRFSTSLIGAIEKNQAAYQETCYNLANSPWKNRLKAYHTSYQDFVTSDKFDLIVSNPPFYKEAVFSNHPARNMARNLSFLPFEVLIEKSKSLLTSHGVLAIIIPYSAEQEVMNLAQKQHLHAWRICRVQGTLQSPIKRSLISFSLQPEDCVISQLIIEKARHQYTQAYINLTQSFYLRM